MATCREELINTLYYFVRNVSLPPGATMTLEPPKTKTGRSIIKDLSTLSFDMGGSKDGCYKLYSHFDVDDQIDLYKKGYELATTKAKRAEVYALMDVLGGTAALLMAGPTAYTRTLVSKNPLGSSPKTRVARYVHRPRLYNHYMYDYGRRPSYEQKSTPIANNPLVYTGVTNFWMAHPARFSIISGLYRMSLELWFDDKYEEIDNEFDIAGCRRWLAEMAKQKRFTTADRKELTELLSWFKPYFTTDKVRANPGAFPLNEYTYDLFLRFCRQGYSDRFTKRWTSLGSMYGLTGYGFVSWCRKQKNRGTAFNEASKRKNWGGLAGGSRISFHGHG
jgi:hypothetical protein